MLNGDKETKYAQRVIKEYGVHEETDIDKLRKLDRKAKRPAEIFAYVYGTVSALVFGVGMCLAMRVIGDLFPLGVVLGIVGIGMMVSTWFIYKKMFASGKKKYGAEILRISGAMLNDNADEN